MPLRSEGRGEGLPPGPIGDGNGLPFRPSGGGRQPEALICATGAGSGVAVAEPPRAGQRR
ncbi:hypothetical protein [Nocardia panacis]|uniref:hypothetical protein n=1 Tax=Nocardia panacis TaxID=2340916 RepID=UPI0013157E1B|nr:hypothetical protein [Nocardia panacis]